MPLKALLIFSFTLFSLQVSANEKRYTLKVDGKSYNFSIVKDQRIALREKTIDLYIEKKKCNEKLFKKLQQNLSFPLNKFSAFLKERNIEVAKCSNGGVEKEICIFLNKLPNAFQEVKVKESIICKKKENLPK